MSQRRAQEAIDRASRRLASAGIESSRLDAEVLMAAAAGVTREAIVIGSLALSTETLKKFDAMIARREKREPVAYILGHKEFYSLYFEVTPAVLIPRPETEFVVGTALAVYCSENQCPRARHRHRVRRNRDCDRGKCAKRADHRRSIFPVDALEVASRNVRRHRVEDRVTIRRADRFDVLDDGAALNSFDVIVSNPPYLDDAEIAALEPEVRAYEPMVALSAGVVGLDILCRIAVAAPLHLANDGELIVEVGARQAHAIAKLVEVAGLRVVSVINDFAGHSRVVHARKSEEREGEG